MPNNPQPNLNYCDAAVRDYILTETVFKY